MSTFASLSSDGLKLFNFHDQKWVQTDHRQFEVREGSADVSWSGDGNWLISSRNAQGTTPIYKLKDKKVICMRTLDIRPTKITCATFFNLTNRFLAFGSEDGTIAIWDIKDRKTIKKLTNKPTTGAAFIAINADDMYMACCENYSNKIRIFGMTTSLELKGVELEKEIVSNLKMSPKKNFFAFTTLEGTTCVWDIYKHLKVWSKKNAHLGTISGLCFSRENPSLLATSSLTKSIRIFDTKRENATIFLDADCAIPCIEFFGTNYLLAGTYKGTVLRYDTRYAKSIVEEIPACANGQIFSIKMAKVVSPFFSNVAIETPDCMPLIDRSFRHVGIMGLIGTPPEKLSLSDVLSPNLMNLQNFSDSKATCTPSTKNIEKSNFESPLDLQPEIITTSTPYNALNSEMIPTKQEKHSDILNAFEEIKQEINKLHNKFDNLKTKIDNESEKQKEMDGFKSIHGTMLHDLNTICQEKMSQLKEESQISVQSQLHQMKETMLQAFDSHRKSIEDAFVRFQLQLCVMELRLNGSDYSDIEDVLLRLQPPT